MPKLHSNLVSLLGLHSVSVFAYLDAVVIAVQDQQLFKTNHLTRVYSRLIICTVAQS